MARRLTGGQARTPAGGRKRLPSEERRREFIEKAIEVFAEEGFESSTRHLASRLGVTQPLIYRYFPSKDDLISEVYNAVYLDRWQPAWDTLLADRSRPVRERLVAFYTSYTDVIFNRDWMRIYLYSGLKGTDINRRYIELVRARILEPIIREIRAEAGLPARDPRGGEVEFAWVMHGGIFYYGVRKLIYESTVEEDDKRVVIAAAVDAFVHGIARQDLPGEAS